MKTNVIHKHIIMYWGYIYSTLDYWSWRFWNLGKSDQPETQLEGSHVRLYVLPLKEMYENLET